MASLYVLLYANLRMKAVKAAIWKNGKESNGKEFFRPEPLKDER